jgi:hypothetical protein
MTNQNKQTAVEWLSEQFDSIVELYPSQFEKVNRAIEQAKEMEKEQMMKAHISAGARLEDISIEAAEDYYNETYGGNK